MIDSFDFFLLQRGVYFEITYSSLILDAQMRRQTISNAKVSLENSGFVLFYLVLVVGIVWV